MVPELVFWLDAPPRSIAGTLEHVANNWNNRVFFICENKIQDDRRRNGWVDHDIKTAEQIILCEIDNPNRFVENFISSHKEAIHICNGFRSLISKRIGRYLFNENDMKLVAWSERPNLYGNVLKIWLLEVLYKYQAYRYKKQVDLYLATGEMSVEAFLRYGWPADKVFTFMYDSPMTHDKVTSKEYIPGNKLRFIYVGRIDKTTKGLDILLKACEQLCSDNWCLDIVGSKGNCSEEMEALIAKDHRISYKGVWRSDEVTKHLIDYDVAIIPSRYDGWNLVTNEALRAGIGVIISDTAASKDLVKASGAGLIITNSRVISLVDAMKQVLSKPEVVNDWKNRAQKYRERISSEVVGDYLINLLKYKYLGNLKPKCPWL